MFSWMILEFSCVALGSQGYTVIPCKMHHFQGGYKLLMSFSWANFRVQTISNKTLGPRHPNKKTSWGFVWLDPIHLLTTMDITVGSLPSRSVADGDFVGDLRREKIYDFNHQSLEPSSINKLKKGPGNTLSNEKNPDRIFRWCRGLYYTQFCVDYYKPL